MCYQGRIFLLLLTSIKFNEVDTKFIIQFSKINLKEKKNREIGLLFLSDISDFQEFRAKILI